MPSGGAAPGATQPEPAGYADYEPLAEWFRRSLAQAGFADIDELVNANRMLQPGLVHALAEATRPLKLIEIRMVAMALGRPADEAESLWRQAMADAERRTVASQRTTARITSWDEIPAQPDPPIRNLLDAQRETVEQLPYRKLMVEPPPLSTIYVRQQVRQQRVQQDDVPEGADPKARRASRDPVTALAALNQHEHLLLTGEPGSGKSTFGYYLTGLLARRWLGERTDEAPVVNEPLLPIRIPARSLIRESSWTKAVADAANETLGMNLVTQVVPELLENRAHGARWLLVIDGLDEITDAEARRTLVRTIAHHARKTGHFRFIVSTRTLPDTELAPLRGERFGHYKIAPFDSAELDDFTKRWFEAQKRPDAAELAARYRHQITHPRLRELVRNPLLATITAVVLTREPEHPLPTVRVDLYDRFYRYLIDEKYSGRGKLEGWLYGRREQLIQHLGRARVETEAPLLETAAQWVVEHRPVDVEEPEDLESLEEGVRTFLIGTGLFVHEGEIVRFLHHSFAEYLSALGIAAAAGPDPESAERIRKRWKGEKDENLRLFALILWGRGKGNDMAAYVRTLMATGSDGYRLAGKLLAEGAAVPDDMAQAIVERLGNMEVAAKYTRFDSLTELCENRFAAAFLRTVTEHTELPDDTRVHAAIALCRVQGVNATAPLLSSMAANGSTPHRLSIVEILTELLPEEDRHIAIGLLDGLADRTDITPRNVARVAEAFHILGVHDRARTIAQRLLASSAKLDSEAGIVATILLSQNESSDTHVRTLLDAPMTPWGRTVLANRLAEAEHGEAATEQLRLVLGDADATGLDLGYAAKVWRAVCGTEADEELETTLVGATYLETDDRIYLAGEMAELGMTVGALDTLRTLLCEPALEARSIGSLVYAWLKASGASSELVERLTSRREIPVDTYAGAAARLAENGAQADAELLARLVLGHPHTNQDRIAQAVYVWALDGEGELPDDIQEIVIERSAELDVEERAKLAQNLAACGLRFASDIITNVLRRPNAVPESLIPAANAIVALDGEDAVPRILEAYTREATSTAHLTAAVEALGEFGAFGELPAIAVALVRHPEVESEELSQVANRLLTLNQRDPAIAALRELLTEPDLPPRTRANASAMLAWLSYMRPGTTCCGVPGCGSPEPSP